jgi:hypothetical protein
MRYLFSKNFSVRLDLPIHSCSLWRNNFHSVFVNINFEVIFK